MICCDCNKELQGGFGIGERPFTKYQCAECTMRGIKNAQGIWCLGEIIKIAESPISTGNRKYKVQAEQLYDKLMKIIHLAKYVKELE